jgi:BlaI family penicillinase repressor
VAARRTSISETELEVLKVLWEHGPKPVRDISALLAEQETQGRKWLHTTVLTLLQRLEGKGYVTSDKRDVAHVFRAAVTRQKLLWQRLNDLAEQLCDGTQAPLVQALVEGRRFTPEEIKRFRRLLEDAEGKG